MLKVVIMAMPTYIMLCFELSKILQKDISTKMENFWWDENNKKKRIY